MPNPYIIDAPKMQGQDPQGLKPVFQNANAQQQFMNSQLGQGGQLGQYQSYGTSQGGSGALALANALRNKNPSDFGNSGMSAGMTNGGVTGNIYDANGQLLTSGNSAPSAATWNQAFGGTGGMGD
jgi:hypothetical protein